MTPGPSDTMAGQVSHERPASSSSPISVSMPFPRPHRRPTIRRKTCRWASWDRWLSAPSSTSLYPGLLTGIVPYTDLNVSDPVALGIDATGVGLGEVPGEAWRHLRTGHGDAGDVAGAVARVLLHVARWPAARVGGRGASAIPHAVDLDSRWSVDSSRFSRPSFPSKFWANWSASERCWRS